MSFLCDLCNYNTQNIYHYNRHCLSKNHLDKEILRLKCYICNKYFKSSTSYKNHKYNFHIKKQNIDNKITLFFTEYGFLIKYIKVHLNY